MIDYFTTFINTNGLAFPDTLSVNATGPSATDGTEVTKNMIDDLWGSRQAVVDLAGLSPNSIAEAPGASQVVEATEKAFGLGAGIYKFWGLNSDPSVTGHRVILLAGQGVLRATYTALDNTCYVGDPDNPTAPYFYHADDAAGTSRNTVGIYLILPHGKQLYEKTYNGDGTDFSISGTGIFVNFASAIPYQTDDGTWRLKFNINCSLTSTAAPTITLSGVVFHAVNFQAVTLSTSSAGSFVGYTNFNNGQIVGISSVSKELWMFSGDVELASEPTWTDGFNYKLGITY